jgi:glycosyltransferase involved in cell wall biosynthesis
MNTKKIKVILLINELIRGGAQQMVHDISNKINKDEFDVHVVYMKSHENFSDRKFMLDDVKKTGVKITCLEGKTRSVIKESYRLYKLLRQEKPDVLHTFMPYVGIIGRIVGRLAGVKSIISLQANVPLAYTKKVYYLDLWTLFLANVWTGAAVGVEKAYAGDSVPFSEEDWSKGRRHFTVISGANVDDIGKAISETNKKEKRKELGIKDDNLVISMTARLISWKGHDDLINAFGLIKESNAELVLIGGGPREDTLRALAKKLGIEDKTHFLGDRSDLLELMAISDVYVQSYCEGADGSMWEGPNTSQMIAAASKIPAISTDVPLVELFMEDGVNGRIAKHDNPEDLAEKIKYLIDNREDAQRMADSAYQMIIDRYSLSAMVGSYEKIYRKLVK